MTPPGTPPGEPGKPPGEPGKPAGEPPVGRSGRASRRVSRARRGRAPGGAVGQFAGVTRWIGPVRAIGHFVISSLSS
jgi:hypothetical protein